MHVYSGFRLNFAVLIFLYWLKPAVVICREQASSIYPICYSTWCQMLRWRRDRYCEAQSLEFVMNYHYTDFYIKIKLLFHFTYLFIFLIILERPIFINRINLASNVILQVMQREQMVADILEMRFWFVIKGRSYVSWVWVLQKSPRGKT